MSTSPSLPLGKFLASSDKDTRDRAIKDLSIYLSSSSLEDLSGLEMAKLWKGIFYCFWMSDKPLVQQALAKEIAELILTIEFIPSSFAFLRGFWRSTVREWSGIDRFRIDKFYMLARRFVNASFRLLIKNEWNDILCQNYNKILTSSGAPLCPGESRVPSLAYHLSDIYLEELDKALTNSPISRPQPAPLVIILAPFITLAARTPAKTTYHRIQSALFEPLFQALEDKRSDEPPDPKRRKLNVELYPTLVSNACVSDPAKEGLKSAPALRKALLARIFDVASEEGTRDSNRRKLYAFWRKFAPDDDGEA